MRPDRIFEPTTSALHVPAMSLRVPLLVAFALSFALDVSVAGGKGGSGGTVSVRGHVRKDGTYVPPHHRTAPDGNFRNNWSTDGNYNPYTGEEGKVGAPPNRPLGVGVPTYSTPLQWPTQPVATPRVAPLLPLPAGSPQPGSASNNLSTPRALDSMSIGPPGGERPAPSHWGGSPELPSTSRPLNYVEQQKLRDADRAQFWEKQGYSFSAQYMTAYSMDQKVKDIERAKFWQERGYTFSADYMTAYSMDQKVKDIERAKFWQERGHTFSAEYMTAYAMDQKAKDIERARFWRDRGLTFDPNYTTAYSMDREAERKGLHGR